VEYSFTSPISGKKRSIPVPNVGGFLQQIGRGVRAAVDPNYAADEYARQWELQNQQTAAQKQRAALDRGMESENIPIWDPVAQKYVYDLTRPTPIVSGLDKNGGLDRRKSDLYKQYAQTPEGQFERYFKTSEMTPYFGNAFQGKGAPTSAQAMIDLASQMAAPTTAPLASYYASQSATGRGSMDEIVQAMGYKGTPMEQWAKANPMLAFREYNKKFPAGQPTMGPTSALPGPPMVPGDTAGERALMEAKYQLSDEPSVGQRTANFLAGVGNPVTPTEALNQGAAVDANRGAEDLRLWQKAKTQGFQQGFDVNQQLF
jgi:hypothetical protein